MNRWGTRSLLAPIVLLAGQYRHDSTSFSDNDKFALSTKSIEAQKEFHGFLRPDQIVTSEAAREARSKAWNSYHKGETYPSMIIFPER